MTGDVAVFTRPEIAIRRNIAHKISSDMSAIRLQFGWWFENFSLSAEHQNFNYQRDLSALSSRPLLQRVVKTAALAQTGLLISEQSSIDLYYPLDNRSLGGHIFFSRSAVDSSRSQSVQFDWTENLQKNIDLTLTINHSDDSSNVWSVSAGLQWLV